MAAAINRCYYVAADMLKSHRDWTDEDHRIFSEPRLFDGQQPWIRWAPRPNLADPKVGSNRDQLQVASHDTLNSLESLTQPLRSSENGSLCVMGRDTSFIGSISSPARDFGEICMQGFIEDEELAYDPL